MTSGAEGPERRLAVVIPVKNDREGLEATLSSLEPVPPGVEVYVVDDGSTDDTPHAADRWPEIRLLRQSASGGSYAARNAGVGASSAPVIAFIDAGCVAAPEWLPNARARLAPDDLAVVAGHISMPLGSRPSTAAMVDVVCHLDQERYVNEFGTAVTANLLTTRRTIETAGLFDATLRSSGDMEWTSRAKQAGATLEYEPALVVIHNPRTRLKQLWRKSFRVARGASESGLRRAQTRIPPYLNPRTLVPKQRSRVGPRLQANGGVVSKAAVCRVYIGQVAVIQIPQALACLQFDARRLHGIVRARTSFMGSDRLNGRQRGDGA